MYGFYINKHYV